MIKSNMHRLATGKVATGEMSQLLSTISELGFDISTRNKFLTVAQLLADPATFDTALGMSDEDYQEVYGAATGGKLVNENTGYNPDEWKDEPALPSQTLDVSSLPPEQQEMIVQKPTKISMACLVKRAGQLEQMADMLTKLKSAGFRMDTKESALQVLGLLSQSGKGVSSATASFVSDMSDEDYAFLVGAPPPPPRAQPAPTPAPQAAPPKPVVPVSQPAPVSVAPKPVAPTPVAAPPSPLSEPSQTTPKTTKGTPGVLPAGPQVELPTKFSGPQKGQIKGELVNKYAELVGKAKQVINGFQAPQLPGDELPVRVRSKDEPPSVKKDPKMLAQEKPGTPVKAGQFVANYDRTDMESLKSRGGEAIMYEAMALGVAPNDGLVVVTFPDGQGYDKGGEFAIWYPKKDNIRLSSHQIKLAMSNIVAQMGGGQAQDAQGNPIIPGDMVTDPNQSSMQNGGQVVDIKQDGSIIYQNDQGQKVMKNPGAPVEVIKQEGPDGQVQQSPQPTSGAGGPNMLK